MPMTIEEWDFHVGYRLESIEYYSKMLEYHVRELAGLPNWQTKAGDGLAKAEHALVLALARITDAQRKMSEKPRVA